MVGNTYNGSVETKSLSSNSALMLQCIQENRFFSLTLLFHIFCVTFLPNQRWINNQHNQNSAGFNLSGRINFFNCIIGQNVLMPRSYIATSGFGPHLTWPDSPAYVVGRLFKNAIGVYRVFLNQRLKEIFLKSHICVDKASQGFLVTSLWVLLRCDQLGGDSQTNQWLRATLKGGTYKAAPQSIPDTCSP